MALTPRSGFALTTSGLNNVPGEIPNTQPDLLNNMPFVTDTLLNNYAIDTAQYPQMTAMLAGFAKGHRVNVTYYRIANTGGSNIRTNIADYAATRNIIDSEYTKILNMEITLPKAFEFNVDPDSASISITGQALLYPNCNPNIGDVFLIGTGDGRIGVARVSSVAPLSWRTGRFYAINFFIQSFADQSDIVTLDSSATEIMIFSKANYLGGTAALLSSQTYVNLQTLQAQRGALCKYFQETFFSTDINSYLRSDAIYDPWVVMFMNNKMTLDDSHIKAKNLWGIKPAIYKKTIWGRLEDRYNSTLNGVYPYQTTTSYKEDRMSVFVTELYGHWILVPSDDNAWPPYIFTMNFYNGTTSAMTAFETLIYNAVTQRVPGDLSTLISTYLNAVYSLDVDTQFYYIPLYIHLIDMAFQTAPLQVDSPSSDFSSGG